MSSAVWWELYRIFTLRRDNERVSGVLQVHHRAIQIHVTRIGLYRATPPLQSIVESVNGGANSYIVTVINRSKLEGNAQSFPFSVGQTSRGNVSTLLPHEGYKLQVAKVLHNFFRASKRVKISNYITARQRSVKNGNQWIVIESQRWNVFSKPWQRRPIHVART